VCLMHPGRVRQDVTKIFKYWWLYADTIPRPLYMVDWRLLVPHIYLCLGAVHLQAQGIGELLYPGKNLTELGFVLCDNSNIIHINEKPGVISVHDASFNPSTAKAGRAVLMHELATVHTMIWSFPICLDDSFQCETYVAWVFLRSLAPAMQTAIMTGKGLGVSEFTDCMSYISALEGKKSYDKDTHVVQCLVGACRELIRTARHQVPQHLYSHLKVGTSMLDSMLDRVDLEAKKAAEKADPQIGYLEGLQPPQVV